MAPDGRGALIEVSLRGDPAQAGYRDRLAAIREHVGTSLQGMEVHVTGVGALAAATFNAFSNIDLTLLLGSVVIVLVLLLVVYRAVLLPLISLLNIGVAYVVAIGLLGVGYTVVDATASQIAVSLLIVLLFGAGTDYALLLISRYREGLHEGDEPREALTDSLLASWEAITASGSTVALAMLAFLAALLPVFRSFGPIIATGIVVTFIAGLTLLPAMMAVLGRAAFWPRVPKAGSPSSHKVWSWVAGKVTARPALSALAVTGALGALCLGLLLYTPVFNLVESFRSPNEATRGYHLLERHFPPGEVAPTTVVAQFPDGVSKARTGGIFTVLQGDPLVQTAAPGPVSTSGDTQLFTAVLSRDPYSSAAISHMSELRAKLHNVAGPGATVLLAGPTMLSADLRATSQRDSLVVGAIALAVVGVVLGLLLRSLVAPLLLLGANLLSFFAALGLTVTISYLLFGGRGFSFEVPLYMFIFLIALGSDYNIFITTRIRQEALRRGMREGTEVAVATTGGVLTSAGIVLAGTFTILATEPLRYLIEVGMGVALGVLLDTFLVRTLLVPGTFAAIGPGVGWPWRRWRAEEAEEQVESSRGEGPRPAREQREDDQGEDERESRREQRRRAA